MYYMFKISETLERIVTIKAKSKAEAELCAETLYDNQKIVLDADDYSSTEIECIDSSKFTDIAEDDTKYYFNADELLERN